MFYEEDEIDELLSCPQCEKKYDDPRIVGCGSSFCMSCIELLTKNDSNRFKCPVCYDFHQQPKKGYLKNKTLAKLCNKKANKVSRSRIGNNFHAQLEDLELKMNKLADEKELGADKIKEYCDRLRNKVQLHLEEFNKSINKQSMKLFEMIDKYENEATLKYDNHDTDFNLRLDDFLSETHAFHKKWTDYLKQFEINDEELKLASKEAKKLQKEINKESDMMLEQTFNFNMLKFKKFRPFFGSLVRCDIKQSYSYALDSMKPHSMSSTTEIIDKVTFKRLSNGNVCIAYCKINELSITVIVYDKNFNQLFPKHSQPFAHKIFKLLESDDAIVLALLNETYETSAIIKFDFNLKVLIQKTDFDFKIWDVDVHQDKFYFLNTCDIFSKNIYASEPDLTNFEDISPYWIPCSVSKLKVNENYFVFLNESNVLVMDRSGLSPKQTFSINSSDFVLDASANRVLTYDKELKQLASFDFNGESIEIDLEKEEGLLELVDFANGRFVFFDPNSFISYL
jgi:hypothetical protein